MRTQIALCVGSGVLGAALMTWILEGPAPFWPCCRGAGSSRVLASPKAGFPAAERSHPAPDQLAQGPQFPQGRRTEAAEPSTPERTAAEPAAGNRPADPPPLAIGRTSLSGDDYTAEERVNIAVYENCNRSVVNISTKVVNQNLMLFESTEEGAGSGSVLDKQGHILTNYHVVEVPAKSRSRCSTASRTTGGWWVAIRKAMSPCCESTLRRSRYFRSAWAIRGTLKSDSECLH